MRFTKAAREAIIQAALNRIMEHPERTFTYQQVAADNRVPVETATSIVRGWQREGVVIVAAEARTEGQQHKLFKVNPQYKPTEEPKGRTSLHNMWQAMRGLKAFSVQDIAVWGTTEAVQVSLDAARSFASALLQAGYLRVERKAMPGKHDAIYRLVKNTGPIPPMVRRVEAVVDLNTGATILIGGGA